MRVVKGRVVGNTVVAEEALPEGVALDILVHEADADSRKLTDKGWAQLREASDAIDKGHFVTDEELQAELDGIDAE
jgi:hypothetical protein